MLSLDKDKLLAPYLREAGLTPKKESYTNWGKPGLDIHIGAHTYLYWPWCMPLPVIRKWRR